MIMGDDRVRCALLLTPHWQRIRGVSLASTSRGNYINLVGPYSTADRGEPNRDDVERSGSLLYATKIGCLTHRSKSALGRTQSPASVGMMRG